MLSSRLNRRPCSLLGELAVLWALPLSLSFLSCPVGFQYAP